MRLTKATLVTELAVKASLTKKQVEALLEAQKVLALRTLQGGDEYLLPGIGVMRRTYRAEKEGRNPQTGEKVKISDHFSPTFKANSLFKAAVR